MKSRLLSVLTLSLAFVSVPSFAAITFFGATSNPTDGGALPDSTNPTAITPLASMAAGDLVELTGISRDNSATIAVSATGGQTWTCTTQTSASVPTLRKCWARFNGTWSANPSMSHNTSGSAFTLLMKVFRPTSGSSTWVVDAAYAAASSTPSSPFDVTVTGQTSTAAGTLTVAEWHTGQDSSTWALQTSGWSQPQADYTNTTGSGLNSAFAYKVNSSAGATGNVTNRTNAANFVVRTIITYREVPTAAALKWNPGVYVWQGGLRLANNPDTSPGQSDATLAHRIALYSFIDSTCSNTKIKGYQVLAYWQSLEGATAGDYTNGFAFVDDLISRASACGKHIILGVQPVSFVYSGSDPTYYFPSYIATGSSYGLTAKPTDSNVVYARVWQAATVDRLIALSDAYGARYDGNASIEMFIPTLETAVGLPNNTDGFSNANLVTQMLRLYPEVREGWPHTMIRLVANYLGTAQQFIDLFDLCETLACSIGGPDTLPRESVMANQIYSGLSGGTDLRPPSSPAGSPSVIPFISEAQGPEMGGKDGTFTPAELWDAALNGYTPTVGTTWGTPARAVKPTHFVWYKNDSFGDSTTKWSTAILPFINDTTNDHSTTGNTACPSAFSVYYGGCQ